MTRPARPHLSRARSSAVADGPLITAMWGSCIEPLAQRG
jgi:hypothetical protein